MRSGAWHPSTTRGQHIPIHSMSSRGWLSRGLSPSWILSSEEIGGPHTHRIKGDKPYEANCHILNSPENFRGVLRQRPSTPLFLPTASPRLGPLFSVTLSGFPYPHPSFVISRPPFSLVAFFLHASPHRLLSIYTPCSVETPREQRCTRARLEGLCFVH